MTDRDFFTRFTQLPNELFRSPVSFNAKWAYVVLLSFRRPGKDIYPAMETLADRAAMSLSTWQRAMSELRAAGMVTVTKWTYRRATTGNPDKSVKITRNVYMPLVKFGNATGQVDQRHSDNLTKGFAESDRRLREQVDDREVDDREVDHRASAQRHPTLFPADFALTPEMVTWAQKETPHVLDIELETKKFSNHYIGTEIKSRNWLAPWRKWMFTAEGWAKDKAAPDELRREKEMAEAQRVAKEFYESEGIEYP